MFALKPRSIWSNIDQAIFAADSVTNIASSPSDLVSKLDASFRYHNTNARGI